MKAEETTAVLEFAKDQFLLAFSGANLLILRDWKETQEIQTESLANYGIYWLAKMPGFDKDNFPFCVLHVSPTFNLVNVKEGTIGNLIGAVSDTHY